MNPLDFFFNGGQQSSAWFAPTTQGVSTYSSGVNPAALEAQVDFGTDLIQYSSINTQTIGSLMGLFGITNNALNTALNYVATALQLFAAAGGG